MTRTTALGRPRPSLVRELWCCPLCLSDLEPGRGGSRCSTCGRQFTLTEDGRPDFRVDGRRSLPFEYAYEPGDSRFSWDLVRVEWPDGPAGFDAPAHWDPTEVSLVRSIPPASAGQRSLDLGCGGDHQRFREPLERLGFEHTGVDIAGSAPAALADIHLLPFPDRTFDLLVTSAVFEHLKQPHIAMAEAARVAKPGARFVGSIAFGEPFHISYFHHSPLAVFELLESAGFECQSLIVSNRWSAFHAHLDIGFAGARYPRWLRRTIPNLFLGASLLHAAVKRALGRGNSALRQDRKSFARSHSAAVGFIAVRTPKAIESRLVRPIR